ncbi:MAG: DUF4040 family protein [Micrococcaceae bacterium]|nr:DUF4040 family protein [Micrococcaceae bacterium]
MLLISLLLALAAVVAAVPASRLLGRDAGWSLALPLLASAGLLVAARPAPGAGPVTQSLPWIPGIDVALRLRLDGLSLVFALLVLVIGAVILAYSSRYLGRDRHVARPGTFYLLMTTFAASMLLLVLADDLVVFFVAWEFTTLASFFLIGRSGDHAREPAIRTLLVTVGGGLALLTAVCIMIVEAGTASITDVLRADFWSGPTGTLVAVLLAVAAFTKSAQFPFQAWLPDSMVAISPVSAYLHAAAMVKAGIYLLLLFSPALAGDGVWSALLIGAGLVTAVFGAMTAMRQHDLKGLLAYSTMSQLGLLTAVIGVGTEAALTAAVVHTVAHALFKCALFMVVGIIDHQAGTRDLRELAARRVRMPATGTLLTIGAVSMAGVPPLFGFVSKEGLLEAGLRADGPSWLSWVVVAGLAWASVFTFAYSGRLVLGGLGLWGDAPAGHATPWRADGGALVSDPSPAFWLPPALPVLATLTLGLAPGVLDPFASAAAAASAGAPVDAHLALWHGLTPALGVTALIVMSGLVLVLARRPVETAARRVSSPVSGLAVVDAARAGIIRFGAWTGRVTPGMAPRGHLLLPSAMLGVFAVVGLLTVGDLPRVIGSPSQGHDWVLVALMAAGVLATIRAKTRIGAVVVVGVVGFASTLWFFNLGAVDVALTQLMVEVLTVCVMVLLLRRLPARFSTDKTPYRALSLVVAAVAGLSATLAVVAFTGRREMSEPARHYLEDTYAQTGAGNIVNSILVDFRAMDTLGELTVLGVAGLAMAALLLNRSTDRLRRTWIDRSSPLSDARENLVYARVFGRVVGPIIILASLVLLVRGHYEPGGGFNSALVAGAGYALMYLSADRDDARGLRWPYLALIGAGVVTGTMTGLAGYLTGDGFLTPMFFSVLGFSTSSALVFDVGVYLAVLGVVIGAFNLLGMPAVADASPDGSSPGEPPPPGDDHTTATTDPRKEILR